MSEATLAIPTWNNPRQLIDALVSLVRNTDWSGRILVVNNGEPCYEEVQGAVPHEIDWIDAGENLGWMGGINLALKHTDTHYFCMMNDDVVFPVNPKFWQNLRHWFDYTDIGGVGPASNFVSGAQSIFQHTGHPAVTVPYLIGFCALYWTEHLKQLGGLDESLPGGDDFDLSIRLRSHGLKLVADKRSYVHHIGQQTGRRVDPGWNSQEHQAATYNALIHKHGLLKWYECVNGQGGWGMPTEENYVAIARRGMLSCQDSLAGLYAKARQTPSDINRHLDTLFRYASGCKTIVETGTDDCTSTAALLAAQPDRLDCFDINRTPSVDDMERHAGRTKFTFHHQSVLEANGNFPSADMWFCDDYHTFDHVAAELKAHADKIGRYVAFHDVALFGEHGEDGKEPGIWKAITDYFREHPEWVLSYYTEELNGLAVYARVK